MTISAMDICFIMVLILLYAAIAIEYSITGFSVVASKIISTLKIQSTDGIKTKSFSWTMMEVVILIILFCCWHVFCSGYSAIR